MKNILFKVFIFYLLLTTCCFADKSIRGLDSYEFNTRIDATKNAREHASMGNLYLHENNINFALAEYQIALKLSPDTQASATYLYNIAICLMKLGYYKDAKKAINAAIDRDYKNITYYEALVDCFIALKETKKQLNIALRDTINPYNRILAGLIYLKTGQKSNAKVIFDEFVCDNPDMIITDDIRLILKSIK